MIRFQWAKQTRYLLNPDHGGQTLEWLNRYAEVACASIHCPNPHLTTSRNASRRDNPIAVGLPIPNWPDPPAFRLNTIYWPVTGAARWAYGCFLIKPSDAIGPPEKGEQPINLSTGILTVDAGDTRDRRNLVMTALPHHLISTDLAIQPFVDARYFYQWRSADLDLDYTSTWAEAIETSTTALGIAAADLTTSTVPAPYLVPDWLELSRHHDNAAILLDALLASVYQRAVFLPENSDAAPPAAPKAKVKLQTVTAAKALLRPFGQDFKPPAQMVRIGGGQPTVEHLPTNLKLRLHRLRAHHPAFLEDTLVFSKALTPSSAKQIQSATTDRTVVSSLYGIYADDGFAGDPTNVAKVNALRDQLATEITAWLDPVYAPYDFTYGGVAAAWPVNGFDDALEIHCGHASQAGLDPPVTRIQSLPANWMPEQQLSQDSDIQLFFNDIEVGLATEDFNDGNPHPVTVYRDNSSTGFTVLAAELDIGSGNTIPLFAGQQGFLLWCQADAKYYFLPFDEARGFGFGYNASSPISVGTSAANLSLSTACPTDQGLSAISNGFQAEADGWYEVEVAVQINGTATAVTASHPGPGGVDSALDGLAAKIPTPIVVEISILAAAATKAVIQGTAWANTTEGAVPGSVTVVWSGALTVGDQIFAQAKRITGLTATVSNAAFTAKYLGPDRI